MRKEREYYRSVLKEALEGLFTDPVTGLYSPPLCRPLAELDIMAHYSFDYAQQVTINMYIVYLYHLSLGALSI